MRSVAMGLSTLFILMAGLSTIGFLFAVSIFIGAYMSGAEESLKPSTALEFVFWTFLCSVSFATSGSALGILAEIGKDISFLAQAERSKETTSKP